jgi:ABC-2 type transport system permease protein
MAASSFPVSTRGIGVFTAFLRRDWRTTKSYRLPFILDAFYGFLNLAVYFFISRTFQGVGVGHLQGAPSYFAFAAVGLIVGTIIDTASDTIAYRIRDEQLAGTLEALLVQPLSVTQFCLGAIAFPFVFAASRATLYLAIAAIWMHLDFEQTRWVGLTLMLLLGAAAITTFGILAGAVALVLKRGEVAAGMAIFALTILSGSVFPVSSLPGWLQQLSKILPLRYVLEGIRHALFGNGNWTTSAIVLAGFALVGVPAAIWIFGRALALSRRAGTVGQY